MTFGYRYRKHIIISLILLIIIGIVVFKNINIKKKKKKSNDDIVKVEKKDNIIKKEKVKEIEIMVDVKGEVNNAGIFKLKEGSRVIDAINLAGGTTQNADTSVLNLSKKLTDEMVIIVYSYYEVRNFQETKVIENNIQTNCINSNDGIKNDACISSDNSETSEKISINTGTLEQLMTLPGVGESKAKSIIEYREKNGEFKNIEDIKKVNGIGDSLFDKIKENITI